MKEVKEALPSLTQLSHLEHLDISQLDELYGDFAHPSHYLEELVKHLPKLRSLDISGTNLASTFREEDGKGRSDGQPCDIPGLAKRIDTPLDFLGLFWTQDEACRREHIPAIRVAGNHNQVKKIFNLCCKNFPLITICQHPIQKASTCFKVDKNWLFLFSSRNNFCWQAQGILIGLW